MISAQEREQIAQKAEAKAEELRDKNSINLSIKNNPNATEKLGSATDKLVEAAHSTATSLSKPETGRRDMKCDKAQLPDGSFIERRTFKNGDVQILVFSPGAKSADVIYDLKLNSKPTVSIDSDKDKRGFEQKDIVINKPNFRDNILEVVKKIFKE